MYTSIVFTHFNIVHHDREIMTKTYALAPMLSKYISSKLSDLLTTCSILSMASWESLLWLARSFLNHVLYSSALMMGIRSLGEQGNGWHRSEAWRGTALCSAAMKGTARYLCSSFTRRTSDRRREFLKKHSVFIHSFNKCLYGTTLMEVYESWLHQQRRFS